MSQPTRRIIKKNRVQVGEVQASPVGTPTAAAPAARPEAPPEINLHRDGDDITAIEVTCGCGKTIIIDCEYPEDSRS